jgi:hypothetical protein
MASNTYTPPGVSVIETVEASISPLLATSSQICLIGPAEGTLTKTDTVTLKAEETVTLPGIEASASMASGAIVQVVDATNPAKSQEQEGGKYAEGAKGFVFSNTAHTIKRGSESAIPDGNTVYVTYKYTPANYFAPVLLSGMSEIEERFGAPYTTTGKVINSPLSYAAAIAFENGAQELILQPLFYSDSGVKQQPNATQIATAATWSNVFTELRTLTSINLLVPVIGQSMASVSDAVQLQVIEAAQDHVQFMKGEQQYITLIAGEDSSTSNTVAQAATLRSHATTLAGRYGGGTAEDTVLISPAKFYRASSAAEGTQVEIGGQYVAAALAGILASGPISRALTRKSISSFTQIGELRTLAEKNADAAAGLLVVEQKGGIIQVRHGITINTTGGAAKREISVVRAKAAVVESLRETLETQVVGNVIADGEAPLIVRSVCIGVLEELRLGEDIVAYSDVQAATASFDPTVIEVRFSYRPAFPVNYIKINFSLNLTNGEIS